MIGMSAGMVSIPVLPEMLESIEDDDTLREKYDMETVENVISGLFVSFQSIGEAIGPMISSYLTEEYGFTISQEAYSLVLLIFCVSYFLTCGNFSMFTKEEPFNQEEEEVSNLINSGENK